VTISAPGLDPRTVDSCEYFRLVAAATGPTALAYGGSRTVPGPSADPADPLAPAADANGGPPALILAGFVTVVVVVVVGIALLRRKGAGAG
jgi:hypothetical protein